MLPVIIKKFTQINFARFSLTFLVLIILLSGLTFFPPEILKTPTVTAQQPVNQPIWKFFGRKTTSENYIDVNSNSLSGKDTLRLTFDLYGTCFHPNESTDIVFDQPDGVWHYVRLSDYAQNCYRGKQTLDIPLTDFEGLNTGQKIGAFHARFWHFENYRVDFYNALVFNSRDPLIEPLPDYSAKLQSKPVSKNNPSPSINPSPVNTGSVLPAPSLTNPLPQTSPSVSVIPSPAIAASVTPSPVTVIPSPSPVPSPSASPAETPTKPPSPSPAPTSPPAQNWIFQSVSSMKISKDMVCSQPDDAYLDRWVKKAKELGANYIAVETPYEDPYCASALEYTKRWVKAIRSNGLNVWHRHMPLAFEGIYDTPKTAGINSLRIISNYITQNPSLFAPEDIFTPIPEPQNGGISGITYCAQNVCQFNSKEDFNKFLRDATDTADTAFARIGLPAKIKTGFWGFDGFVAWGHNNPDWSGILEDATVIKNGEITIDHYPEAVGTSMARDLDELSQKYPGVPIFIGEWGTITGGNVQEQVKNTMSAAKRPGVIGFNYWHLGSGGMESLIEDDFTHKEQFDEVQAFFRP